MFTYEGIANNFYSLLLEDAIKEREEILDPS